MIGMALSVAHKDLRILLSGPGAVCQAFLLGLLIIFIFSLSQGIGETTGPAMAAAIFWISSVFCQILIFGQLYGLEEDNRARDCLIMAPAPGQGIWLGKCFAGLLLLVLGQIVLLPAIIVFLGQNVIQHVGSGLLGVLLGDCGMAILGSLLGAATTRQSGRDALMSILLFPLLLPLLLASTSLLGLFFGDQGADRAATWLGLTAAYDAIFLAAGLVLFGFLYGAEN